MFIIDRFEGEWAVIETDARQTFTLPRASLPPDTREGDVVSISVTLDQSATDARRKKAKKLTQDFFDQ
jgi:hypothetical protein